MTDRLPEENEPDSSRLDASELDAEISVEDGLEPPDLEARVLLDRAASSLNDLHRLSPAPAKPIPAWQFIDRTTKWLNEARKACVNPPSDAGKAAEWLLDNDYQVYRAIRQIREDLPSSFYKRLPALEVDGEAEFPRVFALAHALLQTTHLQVTLSATIRYICAYQRANPLSTAELWAFPTMLRIACLEILTSSLTRILNDQVEQPFEPTEAAITLHSLDDTERVARSIANLSLIASISWEDFFDQTSLVEKILSEDPSGFYSRMDFETRNRYRRAVEKLADYSGRDEPTIAKETLKLAKVAEPGSADHHVGYWLVGDGRRRLDHLLGAVLPLGVKIRRSVMDHAGLFYSAALFLFWVGAFVIPAIYLYYINASALEFAGSILVMLIPASILSTSFVQRIVTLIIPPKVLPKLDFSDGLPPDCPTIVVIPALIAKPDETKALIEQVESHWLSNSDDRLQIALLVDPADAPEEYTETDKEITRQLVSEFRSLNRKYGRSGQGRFHLLMRRRQYNAHEGCWMAWERKRGKLEQFNRLVLEGDSSAFSVHEGDRSALDGLRFVVTVDVDTMLPTSSVAKLAGTLAHPQNIARFDPRTGVLVSGYSILQPRVEMAPQSVSRTLFARFFAGDTAIDIYSRAVSNVYQDLFGSGIFVGKGIYDIAAFHRSVDGRVPENTILSHDLLEGAMGRAGLASDIVLYEGFPGSYLEYAKRWHRWVRGDWQLLPWLGRFVQASDGRKIRNTISGLDRWKIIDNLRRSVVAPSLLLMVAVGWLVLPGNPWFWTILAVFAHASQLFTDLVTGLAQGRRRGAVRGLFAQIADQSGRWFLAIAFLPFESFVAVHAILVALWRQFVSHRYMLQWTSAAHMSLQQTGRNSRPAIWVQMWSGPATSIALGVLIFVASPDSLFAAAPLLLLWFLAPEITARLGRLRHKPIPALAQSDRLFLRQIARRTWLYFETFAGPQDNWLPPDNYQGEPHPETAHRTSPTNIGMMMLSTASAWDLGFLGAEELAARTRNCYDTLDRLERFRGHFLNWYDTLSLRPLEPRYVSVVDSGNLAGCLIAYNSLLREIENAPAIEAQRWTGIDDVVHLLSAAIELAEDDVSDLRSQIVSLEKELAKLAPSPRQWHQGLTAICQNVFPAIEKLIGEAAATPNKLSTGSLREMHTWLDRLRHQLQSIQHDIEKFAPWLMLDGPPTRLHSVFDKIVQLLNRGMDQQNIEQALQMVAAADAQSEAEKIWLQSCADSIRSGQKHHIALAKKLRKLAQRTTAFVDSMEFAPFYSRSRRLFHIGYNASADKLDPHYYDLLASEARLASYLAIAHKQVPIEHWFHLGRPVMRSGKGLALISWNGSMFEYLMPRLLMRSGPQTLLYESEKVAIEAQQAYGKKNANALGRV